MAEAEDDAFTIRDLCEAFDVTPRALRFYESQELLSPRRDGQKRLYSARDRARLRLILRGKRFGFSLAEIRELLELYDIGDGQVTQLEQTLAKSLEKRAQLHDKRRDLDDAIDELNEQIALVETMLIERNKNADTSSVKESVTA